MKSKDNGVKRSMNLFYKPDRTTKPATIALYALFALVCLLGLCKVLIYDLWAETSEARRALAAAEREREEVMLQLADYREVKETYNRYAATEEELDLIDRIEILALLDSAVGATARINSVAISGDTVQLQFSGVTLAEAARIVRKLEESPLVASTIVSTAATTRQGTAGADADSAIVQANVFIQLQKEEAAAKGSKEVAAE